MVTTSECSSLPDRLTIVSVWPSCNPLSLIGPLIPLPSLTILFFLALVNPNRGNALFAKRVQKSEEWIIDDVAEQVIDAARDKLFRNIKNSSSSSSPIPPMSPYYRYSSSSPIVGPVFTPVASSLPSSRPSSAMGSMISQFKDFNPRPKPFCRAF